MSSDPRYIIGELVEVGTPEGSDQPRALIHCTQHDIAAVRRLPMLQRVAIVPLELLHGSDVPPVVEENRRLKDGLTRLVAWLKSPQSDWTGPWEELIEFEELIRPGQVPTEHAEDTEGGKS